MKLDDRRFLSLVYASVLIACALAYMLAVAHPAYGADAGRSIKAYTPFDEAAVRVPQEMIGDARLDQKVKVFCKSRSIKDLFADLSAKTGVKLTTARDVSPQRAIVFFHSRPLRDVLTEISGTYGFHWLVSGKKGAYEYQLFEDTVRAKRRAQAPEDLKAEQDGLLLDFAGRLLGDGRDRALARLGETNPDAYKTMGSQSQKMMMDMISAFGIDVLADVLRNGSSTRRCGDLPMPLQQAICDFYNDPTKGMGTIRMVSTTEGPSGSTTVSDPTPRTPADMADSIVQISRSSSQFDVPRLGITVTCTRDGRTNSYRMDWPSRNITASDMRAATERPVPQSVISESGLPEDEKITIEKLRWLPNKKGLLLGDVLEGIALQTGRDIIADYYLQDKSLNAMKSLSLKQAVETVCRDFDYTCQASGRTLRFRQNKWFTQNMHAEPPVQDVERLWTKIEQSGAVTIHDLVPVAGLSDEQRKWPGWRFVPGPEVACQWPCAVLFLASLDDAQQKEARDGGLQVSKLNADQRQRLDAFLAERKSPLDSSAVDGAVIAISTATPSVQTDENGRKMVTFGGPVVKSTGNLSSLPISVQEEVKKKMAEATARMSANGAVGGMTVPDMVMGNPGMAFARISNSVGESIVVKPADGSIGFPLTLYMPKPMSEAERKEVAEQRRADKAAEVVEANK